MPSKGSASDRLLVAIQQFHSEGETNPSREDVAFRAGIDPKASTMRNAVAQISTKQGLVKAENGHLSMTDKGHLFVEKLHGKVELPKSNDEFHDRCREQLKSKGGGGPKTVAIFDLLLKNDPTPLSKEDIGNGLNMDVKKSTFRNAMAPLRKLKFMEESTEEKGAFCLTSKVFPLGRRACN